MRMKRILAYFKRMSLRTRYILSYILIMAIPLIALGLFFYENHLRDLERSVKELQQYRLEQIRDSFDTRFEDIDQIAAAVANEYKLRPDYLLRLRSHEMEVASLLTAYNNRNTLTREVYLYLFSNDTVYSTDGCMSLNTLTNRVYGMDEGDRSRFVGWLNTAENARMQPAFVNRAYERGERSSNMMIIMHPLRMTGSRPYGVLLFFVRHSSLLHLMNGAMNEAEGSICIFDAGGVPIAGNLPGELEAAAGNSFAGRTGSGLLELAEDGVPWSSVYAVSADTGLCYTLTLPTEALLVPVVRQRMVIFQICLSVLLLGIAMAAMMAWLNYRPIRGLMDDVGLVCSRAANELDALRISMISTLDRNRVLKERMKKHAGYVTERVIELALVGGITEREAMELLREAGQSFPMDCFQVVAVDISGYAKRSASSVRKAVAEVAAAVENRSGGKLRTYSLERRYDEIVLLLLNTDIPSGEENLYGRVVYEELRGRLGEPLFAGAGLLYTGIGQIQKSFVEAMAALESVRFQHKGWLLFSHDGVEQHGGDMRYHEEAQRLLQSLKLGNVNIAEESLENLFKVLSGYSSPLMVRCSLFDITSAVVRFLVELEPNRFEKNISDLMTLHSLGKFYRNMRELIPVLCSYQSQRQITAANMLRDRLLEYVEKHYADMSLSLERIADEFRVSTSFVSHFFSEQTGMPFRGHVSRLRIEHTKKLLAESDMPLREIVKRVGYINVSSFIKKFKRDTGMTPGEWRRIAAGSAQKENMPR